MHRRAATEDDEIGNLAMACKQGCAGDDDIIADAAIMADMGAGEQRAIAAYARDHAATFGAGIRRHILADQHVGADFTRARLPALFEILRGLAECGARMKARKNVVLGKSGYVRVDLGGRRYIKTNKT